MNDGVSEKPAHERPGVVLLLNSLAVGGAERQTISLANLLSERYRVALAYVKSDERLAGQINKSRVSEVVALNAQSRVDLQAVRRLSDLVARHRARLILCANPFSLMYAQMARARSPDPLLVVQVFHSTQLANWKERLSMALYWPMFYAAHDLVFVCDGQRKYWRRRGLSGRRNHMIYNGVDVDRFDGALSPDAGLQWRASLGWKPDDRVVGICAAFRPEKKHTHLLEAVARLRAQGHDWKVLILGDGLTRPAIEAKVTELGMRDRVVFTGVLTDVRAAISACDVIALVSKAEAFSIAALESMAMGKPMVMSDVGGAREQVTDGVHGYIYPYGDISKLAECLVRCEDPQHVATMGAAARQKIRGEFSQLTMRDRYIKLIDTALS